MMYRCYFLDDDGNSPGAEWFECASDDAACERASDLLIANKYHAIELWEHMRQVFRIAKETRPPR